MMVPKSRANAAIFSSFRCEGQGDSIENKQINQRKSDAASYSGPATVYSGSSLYGMIQTTNSSSQHRSSNLELVTSHNQTNHQERRHSVLAQMQTIMENDMDKNKKDGSGGGGKAY